jgi:cardiolipin synthase A/B
VTVVIVVLALGAVAAAVAASGHAILYKRDVRAAIGWTGFVWLVPFFGPLFYLLFGVNRIRRKAAAMRRGVRRKPQPAVCGEAPQPSFARVGDRVLGTPMTAGNRVDIQTSGAIAFDRLLEHIDAARESISLAMYIFEVDATGRRVLDALARAAGRGLEVRVLVDAVGGRSGGRAAVAELNARGAPAALFLPPRFPGMRTLNLRNHRKLVVIDGRVAFTGGMNIADGYAIAPPAAPIHDTAFRIEGPIVRDLQEVFASDWMFTTGESLDGTRWFPVLEPAGEVTARVLADGPDEDFELSRWVILGAIAAARQRIRIVTPYFVPDATFVTALNVAALRGIDVQILIPEVLDHAVVKWASNALLWQVLEKGCRIFFTPLPFDHSKVFTVDSTWSFFGSSNWDARSIRLNFELNIEVFNATLTLALDALIEARFATAREVTLAEVDARPVPIRLRDGLARLLSPYV